MPKSEKQKIKLIKLLEILRMHSDEEHPMTTNQIIDKLNEQGIKSERKSFYDDISVLNEYGYEIMCTRSKQNKYYIADRSFDIAELKILLDAVMAASFISEDKTEELNKKIATLAGTHKAKLLKENIAHFNTVKHTNEKVYYSIDALDNAIVNKKKVSFRYFDYSIKKTPKYRKDGEKYVVNPVALVFSDNNYYLICYSDKYNNLANYRVDRMDGVEVLSEKITPADCVKKLGSSKNSSSVFSMFYGAPKKVTLEADMDLIDVIIDRFGEKVNLIPRENDRFAVVVNVEVSPTFFGWCAGLSDKLKIIAPDEVVSEYLDTLKKAASVYEE